MGDIGSDGRAQRGLYAPLVPLQLRPDRVPAYVCIPGAGGDVTSFMDIVSRLDETWPVYGLQPRGVDGALVPHSTVRAAVLSFIEAIDDAYLQGPLHLVAHSFGGWLAFEMACLLSDAGRPVTAVTLLDSNAPDAESEVTRDYTDTDCLQAWLHGIEQRLGRPLRIDVAQLESCAETQRCEILHRQLVKAGILPSQSRAEVLRGRLRAFSTHFRTNYCPERQYRGPVTLVVADDPDLDVNGNAQRAQEAIDGWRRWAPDLRYVKGPGNHMTMLSPPHVEFVANVIRHGTSSATMAAVISG